MMTFKLATWRCSCGYGQDFAGGKCPSCGLGEGLRAESDPALMSTANFAEVGDVVGEGTYAAKDVKSVEEVQAFIAISAFDKATADIDLSKALLPTALEKEAALAEPIEILE